MFDRVLKILLALKREHHHLHHQRSGCETLLHWTSSWMRLMSQNLVNPTGNTPLLGHGKDLHHLSEPSEPLSPLGFWLFPVSDWVDGLIGPSGLLLVVSPPTCSRGFSFIMAKVGTTFLTQTLDVRNIIFARLHTKRWWRCSKRPWQGR